MVLDRSSHLKGARTRRSSCGGGTSGSFSNGPGHSVVIAPRFNATESGLRLLSSASRSNYTYPSRSAASGRILATAIGPVSQQESDRQGLYLHVVSIAEATIDALALELSEQALARHDEVVRRLLTEKEIASSASWEARRRSFRRHHGLNLRQCDAHEEVMATTEVRNAIAHGLGRLTARQVTSGETLSNLRRISVDVVDGRVRLVADDVANAVAYCRRFISAVDALV